MKLKAGTLVFCVVLAILLSHQSHADEARGTSVPRHHGPYGTYVPLPW